MLTSVFTFFPQIIRELEEQNLVLDKIFHFIKTFWTSKQGLRWFQIVSGNPAEQHPIALLHRPLVDSCINRMGEKKIKMGQDDAVENDMT